MKAGPLDRFVTALRRVIALNPYRRGLRPAEPSPVSRDRARRLWLLPWARGAVAVGDANVVSPPNVLDLLGDPS